MNLGKGTTFESCRRTQALKRECIFIDLAERPKVVSFP